MYPCFIVAVCPSLPPSLLPLQPEELTLLLIKLRRQQAELNSIREHTVAQLMQLNMDGDNSKVRPPEMPLQASLLACAVFAIFTHLHYSSGSRGFFFWSSYTADLSRKATTVGIFSINDYALAWSCLLIIFRDQLTWIQLLPKHVKCLETKIISFWNQHLILYRSSGRYSYSCHPCPCHRTSIDWVILLAWRIKTDVSQKWNLKPFGELKEWPAKEVKAIRKC